MLAPSRHQNAALREERAILGCCPAGCGVQSPWQTRRQVGCGPWPSSSTRHATTFAGDIWKLQAGQPAAVATRPGLPFGPDLATRFGNGWPDLAAPPQIRMKESKNRIVKRGPIHGLPFGPDRATQIRKGWPDLAAQLQIRRPWKEQAALRPLHSPRRTPCRLSLP